jgi:AcrR family transcriptional regulator
MWGTRNWQLAKASDIAQRRALAKANDDPEYRLRRAELVEAAARVFQRKGLNAAKLEDIAKEVGKDRASLYYYTSGKEELFQEVVEEAVSDNVKAVERLFADPGPADHKLAVLIRTLMESYTKHFPYLFVYIQEPMAHADDSSPWHRGMIALQRRFDKAIRGVIQQGLDEGTLVLPVRDARVIANGIIGMCTWSHRWFHPKVDRPDQVADVFIAALLQGLTPRT